MSYDESIKVTVSALTSHRERNLFKNLLDSKTSYRRDNKYQPMRTRWVRSQPNRKIAFLFISFNSIAPQNIQTQEILIGTVYRAHWVGPVAVKILKKWLHRAQNVYIDESRQMLWQIYFWIGAHATLHKRACAAIHAHQFEKLLGRTMSNDSRRTRRWVRYDFFCAVRHSDHVHWIGVRTVTGFCTVKDVQLQIRMYRVHASGASIHLEPVPLDVKSLDPRFVFGYRHRRVEMFMWYGTKIKEYTQIEDTFDGRENQMSEKINSKS